MGRSSRVKPRYLAEKLLRIRLALELSQEKMLERLGEFESMTQASISMYEAGTREPPLPVLCRYADLANVTLDVLARDELDLPGKIPTTKKSEGVKRTPMKPNDPK